MRDSKGRFAPGNPGGPGRKPRATEEAYLRHMETVVDDEAWEKIVQRATLDAIDGDSKARTWLSNYLLGAPVQRVENNGQSKIEFLLDRLDTLRLEDGDLEAAFGEEGDA